MRHESHDDQKLHVVILRVSGRCSHRHATAQRRGYEYAPRNAARLRFTVNLKCTPASCGGSGAYCVRWVQHENGSMPGETGLVGTCCGGLSAPLDLSRSS